MLVADAIDEINDSELPRPLCHEHGRAPCAGARAPAPAGAFCAWTA
jgi:hypothetical protein